MGTSVVERAELHNVRCHRRLTVNFGDDLTVILGTNGAGKTSILEGLSLVLSGVSPRAAAPREVISTGEDVARVQIRVREAGGLVRHGAFACDRGGERRQTLDGLALDDSCRWEETVPMRIFLPDDLQLIKGGPRLRRRFLDQLAGREDGEYRRLRTDYDESLRQRNALLHRGVVGADHRPWEVLLARQGLALMRRRDAVLEGFAPLFGEMYCALADGAESAGLAYRTNVAELGEEVYRERLADQRASDRQRGFTHTGPHRDDLRFLVGGRDLRESGSQGEQRTAVLALLLAERRRAAADAGVVPLLLLDDVMSELDARRRRALLELVRSEGQTVMTTTDLHYFAPKELASARVVTLEARVADGEACGAAAISEAKA